MEINNYVQCFKALSDDTRLKIVVMLKDGCMCACRILEHFNITQPTLSYHMKQLVDCELVICEKVGTWNHYSLNDKTIKILKEFFKYDKNCNYSCNQ